MVFREGRQAGHLVTILTKCLCNRSSRGITSELASSIQTCPAHVYELHVYCVWCSSDGAVYVWDIRVCVVVYFHYSLLRRWDMDTEPNAMYKSSLFLCCTFSCLLRQSGSKTFSSTRSGFTDETCTMLSTLSIAS